MVYCCLSYVYRGILYSGLLSIYTPQIVRHAAYNKSLQSFCCHPKGDLRHQWRYSTCIILADACFCSTALHILISSLYSPIMFIPYTSLNITFFNKCKNKEVYYMFLLPWNLLSFLIRLLGSVELK